MRTYKQQIVPLGAEFDCPGRVVGMTLVPVDTTGMIEGQIVHRQVPGLLVVWEDELDLAAIKRAEESAPC